ncbi:MAG: YcgL domain-containing protein [Gammaproteobacteria bacterium]|nr:MAG: YcgL domain-containing protein [Gammaproteobacteria bacterium]
MSTPERRIVSVFKSSRRDETYVYVDKKAGADAIPEALRAHFGEPVHVMDLLLTPDRKLARVSATEVLEAIEDKGLYLQMPPPPEEECRPVIEAAERYKAFSRSAHED